MTSSWSAPDLPDDDRLSLGSASRPVAAAFFFERAGPPPAAWLPGTLARMGVSASASTAIPGGLQVADWGGLFCEVHQLDLEWYTVLVLVFSLYPFLDQKVEQPLSESPAPPPGATPLARAFRDACARLAPDLEVAFVQTSERSGLLRLVADQEARVASLDGYALLNQGFSLVYLTDRLDYHVAPALVAHPRDALAVDGGRIFFGGTGQQRW